MEDLRQTALAYYTAATKEIKSVVDEFYSEMDRSDAGHVRFKEFAMYMDAIGCNHLSSDAFFDELRQEGNDVLFLDDVITLFYIIHSGRPICGGSCRKLAKGMYFTCVKCFDDTADVAARRAAFSVCSQCFSNEKNYEHEHDEFLDPIVMLHLKRMEALDARPNAQASSRVADHETSSSTVSKSGEGKREAENGRERISRTESSKKVKYERSSSSSSISSIIVYPSSNRDKKEKTQTAIQLGQLVASIGSIVVAAQLCTIM